MTDQKKAPSTMLLLQCPFCGGEPSLTHDHYVHDDLRPMPTVECKSCSAWVRLEDWNNRTYLGAPGLGIASAAQPHGDLPARFPEINFSNYGQQEAEALQAWAFEALEHIEAVGLAVQPCGLPPTGWSCTRGAGHGGPCAAILAYPPVPDDRKLPTVQRQVEVSDELLMEVFFKKMLRKMDQSKARGRSGWEACSQERLTAMLRGHVEKGDPVDVANFCFMLAALGMSIGKPSPKDDAELMIRQHLEFIGLGEDLMMSEAADFQDAAYALGLARGSSTCAKSQVDQLDEPAAGSWIDGSPPAPWDDEWFLASTIYGHKIALKPLPEEYAYDFTTADGTYMMRASIKKWAQLSTSQYVPCYERPRASAVMVDEGLEIDKAWGAKNGLECWGHEPTAKGLFEDGWQARAKLGGVKS